MTTTTDPAPAPAEDVAPLKPAAIKAGLLARQPIVEEEIAKLVAERDEVNARSTKAHAKITKEAEADRRRINAAIKVLRAENDQIDRTLRSFEPRGSAKS